LNVGRWCEEAEAVLDDEEAVKEFVWVECEKEMVRCLVAADGWRKRVGGGDDDKRKKKKRVSFLWERGNACVVFCYSDFYIRFNPSP